MSKKGKLDLPQWILKTQNVENLFCSSDQQDQPEPQQAPVVPSSEPIPQQAQPEQIASEHSSVYMHIEAGQVLYIRKPQPADSNVNKTNQSLQLFMANSFKSYEEEKVQEVKQIFQNSEEKIVIAMDHLVSKGGDEKMAHDLGRILKHIELGKLEVKKGFLKMQQKDHRMVTDHKTLLGCLAKTIKLLLTQFQPFACLRKIDFLRVIQKAYSTISCQIQFDTLQKGFLKALKIPETQSIPDQVLRLFVKKLIIHSEGDFERKRAEARRLRKKKKMKQRNISYESQQQEERHGYDGQSIYGLFENKQQEFQRGSEGIRNYRMHRTLQFMRKLNIVNPFDNIEKAKDFAAFLIKLTDIHMKDILSKTVQNCRLSLENKVPPNYSKVHDQFSYFSSQNFHPKSDPLIEAPLAKVQRLCYPSRLTLYNELRYAQMIKENKHQLWMYPQIFLELVKRPNRGLYNELMLHDYYCYTQIPKEMIDQHRFYRRQAPPQASKIKIQHFHIVEALEDHPTYHKSLVLMRLKAIY